MTHRGGSTSVADRGENGTAHRASAPAMVARALSARATTIGCLAAVVAGVVLMPAPRAHGAQVYSYRDRGGTQHFTNVPTDSRYRALPVERTRPARIGYVPRAGATSSGGSRFARTDRIWNEPPADLNKLIEQTARRYGVETALVHAVVRAESDFDCLALSSSGAQGLMQLMPATASEVGVRDAFHPQQNLEGGVYYLRSLLDRFEGNTQLAVAGYNAGPGAVERFGGVPPYAETIEYIERVFRFRQEYLLNHRMDRQPRVVVASR